MEEGNNKTHVLLFYITCMPVSMGGFIRVQNLFLPDHLSLKGMSALYITYFTGPVNLY